MKRTETHSMTEAWQKRSKYQPQFFLNLHNWCYKSFLYTANKKSKLIGRLPNFTNPFIPPCDNQVSDADNLFWFHQHMPCYCRNIFHGPHYNPNVPYICTQYVSCPPSHMCTQYVSITVWHGVMICFFHQPHTWTMLESLSFVHKKKIQTRENSDSQNE